MKSNQSGVKLSFIVISIIVLGVSAWFNQANAEDILHKQQSSTESTESIDNA